MVRFILLVCLAIYAQANFLRVPHLPIHLPVAHRAPYGQQLYVPPPAPRGPYGLPPPTSPLPVHPFRAGYQDNGGYCRQSPQHTMCLFPGPAPFCRPVSRGLSPNTLNAVLDRHNQLRAQVAQGNQPGQPPAANMNQLVWNTELADIAQRWADQCNFGHDDNRNKLDGTQVGQNVAFSGNSRQQNEDELTNVAIGQVDNWFNEVSMFNPNSISNYMFDFSTGHYSQMVWADTTELGCGSVYYQEGGFWRYYLVCNYAVAGNFQGMAVYQIGEACSGCGGRGCQNGLCL